MKTLKGIFTALTTPFQADGSLAADKIRDNISRYNRVPLTGYLAVGSTGESVFLSRTEVEQTYAAVREAAAPDRTLLAGTGSESTAETISRTELAAKIGYDYALVKTPSFYKASLTTDAYVEHYWRVADASKIPVLLYSVPQFTGVAIEPDLVARLAEHPNIVGMKDSSGNVQRAGEILASVPARFQLLIGSADTVYPSMALGAVGGVLAIADCIPELCVEMYQAAAANQSATARDLQRRVFQATKNILRKFGLAGLKCAMDHRGYYGGPVRSPLLQANESQRRAVQAAIDSLVAAAAAD